MIAVGIITGSKRDALLSLGKEKRDPPPQIESFIRFSTPFMCHERELRSALNCSIVLIFE